MKNSFWDLPLKLLYFSWWGKLVRVVVRSRWVSKIYGWYCDSSWSARSIKSFVRDYAIDVSEFEKSLAEFKSFNDFFIRKLKKEARPINQSVDSLVSPGDGSILVVPNLECNNLFVVKGARFTLEQFLGDQKLAQEFKGGAMATLRLAPQDYHRYHFPIDTVPLPHRLIDGTLEAVNPMVYRSGVQPLVTNERHVIEFEAAQLGRVLMVVIGAMFVGRIHHTYKAGRLYHKGDEAGYFACGGSTIVLLFEQGVVEFDQVIIEQSAQGVETKVKMGQRVGGVQSGLLE